MLHVGYEEEMALQVQNITDAEFSNMIASGVTLVDFWAPWCAPCKAMAPLLDEIAAELGDRAKIVKVNIDESRVVAVEQGIMSAPTFLLFKEGRKVAARVGAMRGPALRAFVDQAF